MRTRSSERQHLVWVCRACLPTVARSTCEGSVTVGMAPDLVALCDLRWTRPGRRGPWSGGFFLSFRWYLFATPAAALLAAWLVAELQRRLSHRAASYAIALGVAGFAFIGASNGSVNQDSPWYGQRDTLLTDVTAADLSMRSYLQGIGGARMASDWEIYQAIQGERLAAGSSIEAYRPDTWPPGAGTRYGLVALREADYQRALALPQPVARQWWLGSPRFAKIYDSGSDEVWLRSSGDSK